MIEAFLMGLKVTANINLKCIILLLCKNPCAHIIKVAVYTVFWRSFVQGGVHVNLLVVVNKVKSQFPQPITFVVTSGEPNYLAALYMYMLDKVKKKCHFSQALSAKINLVM
jgi:hypothetical protein